MTVESQSTRRHREVRNRRPRRPVPADLRGRCFNCFAVDHRAFQCKSRPRCFTCKLLGHRSVACPRRGGGAPRRVSVWRRIGPAVPADNTMASAAPVASGARSEASDANRAFEEDMVPDSSRRGRRRRRPRRRRRNSGEDGGSPAGNGRDASLVPPALNDGVPPASGPPCVIDWSDQLARAETDLRTAVIVTVVGSCAGPAMSGLDAVKIMVAHSLNLAYDTMVLRRSHVDGVFVLLGEDDATVSRLVHAGPFPGPGDTRLLCRRWTRQAFAEGVALPLLVNVEFKGIPAHAWEMSTAESLLSPYGWPQLLHSSTRNREDYASFRLSAWCFNPREVPLARDLHVVEPPVGDISSPPGKLTLVYPVSIAITEVILPTAGGDVSVGSSGDSSGGDDRRRRRRSKAPRTADMCSEPPAAVASS